MHVAGTEVYAPVLDYDTSVSGHRQGQLGRTGTGSHAPLSADEPEVFSNPWVGEGNEDDVLDGEFYEPLDELLDYEGLAQEGMAGETSPLQAAESFGFAGLASSAVGTPSLPAVNGLTNTQAGASHGQTAAALAGRDASESAADADMQNLVQSLNSYHISETVLDADDPVADNHIQASCEA